MEQRSIETHIADRDALNEALRFYAVQLNGQELSVQADVLQKDRSIYSIFDSATGQHRIGDVEKTATMWKFTTPDGCVFRSRSADLIAIRSI